MQRFLRHIYNSFFAPRQKDEDIRNRELVLNVLLAGTLLILGLAVLVIAGYYVEGRAFVVPRAFILSLVFLFVFGIYRLSRAGQYRLAAWLLVGVYLLLAAGVGLVWSVTLPSAVLLYGLVVVLAGILLGPRYSLIGFGIVVLLIVGTAVLGSTGTITYDLTWKENRTGADDVFGLTFMLGMIAAVSWLFNYQMARSLHRAERAEAALRKQKDLLETTVEERTRELQAAQLEKIQQMYRFAELGQLSTALLHDLANHLTTLTMDIEGLQGTSQSRALSRAKRSVRYIDEMVVRVRRRLQGEEHIRQFGVTNEIDAVVMMLTHRAINAHTTIEWRPPAHKKSLRCQGDPIRFRQCMANLITNAIDAYATAPQSSQKRAVRITAEKHADTIVITISDWGIGIAPSDRAKLFEPFYSTKKTGMGMGLYIVKQVVEEHFLGTVAIDQHEKHTVFVVTLPAAEA